MNAIRPNLHNILMIVLIAILGIVALKLGAKRLGNVPVLGQVLSVATAA